MSTAKKSGPVTLRGIAANAACIGAEVRNLMPGTDIGRIYDKIIDAALALSEVEAEEGFSWETSPNDWESVCYAAAGLISDSKETDWSHFFRKTTHPPSIQRSLKEALEKVRGDKRHPLHIEAWHPSYWRTSQYPTYEAAKEQGGVYKGEVCYGLSSFLDSMSNVAAAMNCCDGGWDMEGLMVRILADGVDIGDFELSKGIA
jgi:hypothetical protein